MRTCCEMKEVPSYGKGSWGSSRDGGGSCPCHPVSQSAGGRMTTVFAGNSSY